MLSEMAVRQAKAKDKDYKLSDSEGLYPKTIRVDNGSEFISRDMDLWAYQRGVTLELASPPFGSPALANPRTMRSSKRSTASCAASA